MSGRTALPLDAVVIDPENPWLGLFSYSEPSRAYFHGRDEEAAELCRRVQRKLLTVLFGQSGLGKTSLLRAGVVPTLRAQGYCPVYVRVDYAPDSPSPAEQIKQAIFRASAAVGAWSRPGSAIEGESLWEFLHHRGDLLRDSGGHTLTPLLIFDQFEEIFTLGQSDDAGRQRARQFLDDLADLVENRPPAALEARIEDDDAAAEDFDFARADYRVLIALREDYLAHLEGIKAVMPSITQNRMRLARMTGDQALAAVIRPGGRLVSQEIAEAIVRFVAGGAELAHAEVEPSLLSLVCRELNGVRKAQGQAEISAGLLAGSRDSILSEFYERALADQPEGVRRVVEDLLLTESGYRESLGEERVLKELAAAGASAGALATLVDRRLLRIEERVDMRRVEITHDVLCGVVLASRNLRHERQARDAAERELAQQREREAATHRALVRARTIASVCIVLALVAIAGAIYGWVSQQRARAAEAMAEKSRGDAEKLVGFLIEDFYNELAPTGRLETLGRLARMTVAYYDGLPPQLVTPRTRTYRAMAQVREGAALLNGGHVDAAFALFAQAQAGLAAMRAGGDHSEPVTFGLALIEYYKGSGLISGGSNRGSDKELQAAVALLRPLVHGPDPSRRARQLYADTLNFMSHDQSLEQGVATCDEARRILVGLGALDLSNLDASASYADTADSEARFLLSLGRVEQALTLEQQVLELTEKVLAHRPGDLHSLANRFYATQLLSVIADRRYDPATAIDYAERAVQAGADGVRYNPSDRGAWFRSSLALQRLSESRFDHGEIAAAIAAAQRQVALANAPGHPAGMASVTWLAQARLAMLNARAGDFAAARQATLAFKREALQNIAPLAADSPMRMLLVHPEQSTQAAIALLQGDAGQALRDATEAASRATAVRIPATDVAAAQVRWNMRSNNLRTAAIAALRLGQFAPAEAFARQRLALTPDITTERDPNEEVAFSRTLLAHALAGQGRLPEARRTLQDDMAWYAKQRQAGAGSTTFRLYYAYALYVDGIAQDPDADGARRRQQDLAAAAAQVAGASDEARRLQDMLHVAGLIAAARGK